MIIIQAKYILQQLSFDLIGKDSYRGITLTYAWLANQFGHIALGFIPTFIIYQLLKNQFKTTQLNLFVAIAVSCMWLFFELFNFLQPLIYQDSNYVFNPDWFNVIFDTTIDVCFFALGAFIAGISIKYSPTLIYINVFLFISIIYPSYYWYTTKMYQQEAKLPFQYRLSQWKTKLDDESKSTIVNFINNNGTKGHHLLISGNFKSGKTSLSVAIANEQSIKHKKALYTSATKFYNLLYEPNPNEADIKINNLWSWRNTDYLVIDDINPSIQINNGNINPQTFYNLLNNKQFGKQNIDAIKQTNIIWVLGAPNGNCCDWKELLLSMGVAPENISQLNLL